MLIKNFDDLPVKIQSVLTKYEQGRANFICGIKSELKVSYETPYMWIVVTKESLVLCNTHNSKRGHWASYNQRELNSMRIKKSTAGFFALEILETDPTKPNINIHLPRKTSEKDAREFDMFCRKLITREG
jgi:hypothetical protein